MSRRAVRYAVEIGQLGAVCVGGEIVIPAWAIAEVLDEHDEA